MLSHPPSGRVPLRGFTGRPTYHHQLLVLEVFYTRQSHLTITRLTSALPVHFRFHPGVRETQPQWTNNRPAPTPRSFATAGGGSLTIRGSLQ